MPSAIPLAPEKAAISVETEYSVRQGSRCLSTSRGSLYFPGPGHIRHKQGPGPFPGVEYLENEPSSSEAEIEGEQANRRIIDDFRLCYPMMALAQDGKYSALAWDRKDHPAPVFDSPDRIFNSGAQVLGLGNRPWGAAGWSMTSMSTTRSRCRPISHA